MLNELFELSRSIDSAGIAVDEWDDTYKECPKNAPTFLLYIGNDATIKDIAQVRGINKAETERLRTAYRKVIWPNQGISFPAFSVLPFLHADSPKSKELLNQLKAEIRKTRRVNQAIAPLMDTLWSSCIKLWLDTGLNDRVAACLKSECRSSPPRTVKEIVSDVPTEFRAIAILLNRALLISVESLTEQIKSLILNRLVGLSAEDAKDWIDRLLITSTDTIRDGKGNIKSALNITFILELDDWAQLGLKYPANHLMVQRWVNSKLLGLKYKELQPTSNDFIDAFGFPMSLADSKTPFPSPRIEILGDIKLRSMFREKPCQVRYGKIESESYPVSFSTREKMKNSLRWLGSKKNKDRTWTNVSGTCGFRKGLAIPSILMAYPSCLSLSDQIELAALFGEAGPPGLEDTDQEARFTAISSRVITACRSLAVERPDAYVHILVLSKADQTSNRTKLVLSRHYAANRICTAAEEWRQGCQNIPKICLNIGTKNKAVWIVPFVPFPTEVVSCLNIAWYRDGNRAEIVSGINIGDGLSLLLEQPPYIERTANRLLIAAMKNISTLLLAVGHADHKGDGSFTWDKNTKPYAKHANLLPCILGLILHKLGYKKGDYMHTASFLVGQMMSLADTLHKEYCIKVRASRKKEGQQSDQSSEGNGRGSGGLPRQLIGNAAMSIAMDNPTAGLARLSERILIYQSWANTTSGDIGYAGWALGEFRRISEELGKLALPERCTDADKAQILLGYLSRIGDSQKTEINNTINTESEE